MLTADRLREVLTYVSETGQWFWKGRTWVKDGSAAGTTRSTGRRIIRIDGHGYIAARLAFLWMTGEWPVGCVDHIDCDHLNDRWSNLRQATLSQNSANRNAHCNNKLGVKGVHVRDNGTYVAKIMYRGKKLHLGYFKTVVEAAEAYESASDILFGVFCRGRIGHAPQPNT
jgi:hypothetical protein